MNTQAKPTMPSLDFRPIVKQMSPAEQSRRGARIYEMKKRAAKRLNEAYYALPHETAHEQLGYAPPKLPLPNPTSPAERAYNQSLRFLERVAKVEDVWLWASGFRCRVSGDYASPPTPSAFDDIFGASQ